MKINFNKQTKQIFLWLSFIIILAFFLRIYNLNNWLYFQADQVRNTNHAHKILEQGWTGVPLLGPKAGGTDFHLGPISYYLEAIPALIFGLNHPAIIVYSNLFFILLSIILAYYFLRQGFSRFVSLSITTLYAFSYVTIQYSRFSWNPNSMLFWGLLFVLATYKIFQTKDKKKAGWWLVVLGFSYGVVSQLHTTALLGYPGVFILYWLYKRSHPKTTAKNWRKNLFISCKNLFHNKNDRLLQINWRYWLGSFLILGILYSPLVIYDLQNQGHNLQEFKKAFVGKTSSDGKTIGQKLQRELNLMGKYYALNVFSLNRKEIPWGHHKDFWLINLGGLSCLLGAGFLIGFYFFKNELKKKIKEKNIPPVDFLVLNFIWWLVFFVLFFPLAYKLDQMRFWFIAFLIPYIALAIIFSWLENKKYGRKIIISASLFILILNLSAVANWYIGLAKQDGQNRFFRQPMTSTLQQSDWVTYDGMLRAVKYMNKKSIASKEVCFRTPSKNRSSYRYIFAHTFPNRPARILRGKIIASDLKKCDVYLIKHSPKSTEDIVNEYLKEGKNIKLEKPQHFGVITVWKVKGFSVEKE